MPANSRLCSASGPVCGCCRDGVVTADRCSCTAQPSTQWLLCCCSSVCMSLHLLPVLLLTIPASKAQHINPFTGVLIPKAQWRFDQHVSRVWLGFVISARSGSSGFIAISDICLGFRLPLVKKHHQDTKQQPENQCRAKPELSPSTLCWGGSRQRAC